MSSVSASVQSPPPDDLDICTELRFDDDSTVHVSQILMRAGKIVWYEGAQEKPDLTIGMARSDAELIAGDATGQTGLDLFAAGRIVVDDPKGVLDIAVGYCMTRINGAIQAVAAAAATDSTQPFA